MVNFDVEWLADLNEVSLSVRYYDPNDAGQPMGEQCFLVPKAIARELRYALDRALNHTDESDATVV
jgi:hypothetical protein